MPCPSHATRNIDKRLFRSLALTDFSDCSSRFTVRDSFLQRSDLCSSSYMTPHPLFIFVFYIRLPIVFLVFFVHFRLLSSHAHNLCTLANRIIVKYFYESSIRGRTFHTSTFHGRSSYGRPNDVGPYFVAGK